MTSAVPISQGQTSARPSFAKVAAQTYKPQMPKEQAPSVKPSIASPQPAISANVIKPPTVGSAASAVRAETKIELSEANGNAGDTASRAGESAGASGESAVVLPSLKEEDAARLRPSIALVKFSTIEDSNTQLSSSDGSAKPPSLDGKSVASGTTFALDEKESLRPDDSASLRAVEEEDVTSPPESNAAGSRVGSDSEARAFRAQLHEIAVMGPQPQRGVPPGRFPVPTPNGSHTLYDPNQPPNAIGRSLSQPIVTGMPQGAGPQTLPAIPDEKLIEALQSPRDRLFVVKIEQDFIDFIKDSRESEYCLPNCNTFYRMLAHRLADYYLLGHVVDNTMTGVRITRTPYCRIPPPLSQMVDATKSTNTPPVDLPARKIMRRGDDTRSGTNTGANSENPSKAASEVDGSDGGNDKTDGKRDKSSMTREEREARYREARQRIFGSAESEEADSSDVIAQPEEKDASRSSSASGKKKNKKQRNQDDDDGFEARSRFNAYYPGQYAVPGYTGDGTLYYSGYPTPMTNAQYSPMGPNASPPSNYGSPYPAVPQDPQGQYWSSQQFPQANGPMMYPNYGQMQNGQDLSSDFQRGMQSFQNAGMPSQVTPKMATASMAGYPDPYAQQPPNSAMSQGWSPMSQQPSYPISQGYASNGPNNRPMTAPMQGAVPGAYPYGQFPAPTFNGKPNRNQHPIPGSYQRPQFNPQSQAFIPGGRNMPYQMGIHNGPQMMNGYGNYQMGPPQMAHQMPRPSPPTANSATFGPTFGPTFGMIHSVSNNVNSSPPNQSNFSSQNATQLRGGEVQDSGLSSQSSIAKYGTPSNLPARPPPTQQQPPKFTLPGHSIPPGSRLPSNPPPPFGANAS
ncbi:uncharacterized protein N0V89_002381 [Didymosphaeria variabile]|uniref:SUZ domain-containing protein n=1 Tax=Didymosphaeria variabile TaxID=1932322 RepID=A0A9W8XRJ6_9PLEO|nr:uncharacterized protein N0V89_002381 [Didymosphaeria variabile]KAJ4357805.1 hypothetical protein N0V89_002381 [Didymosphaeria variabile]